MHGQLLMLKWPWLRTRQGAMPRPVLFKATGAAIGVLGVYHTAAKQARH